MILIKESIKEELLKLKENAEILYETYENKDWSFNTTTAFGYGKMVGITQNNELIIKPYNIDRLNRPYLSYIPIIDVVSVRIIEGDY